MTHKNEPNVIGRGWAFPLQLGAQGELISLTNEWNEIEQAMHIILLTSPGERVMRPTFGCQLQELVFAPNDRQTAVLAERYVEEALTRWEPRITVTNITAGPAYQFMDEMEQRRLEAYPNQLRFNDPRTTLLIHIDYTIKATDDPRSLVFPFYLIPGE